MVMDRSTNQLYAICALIGTCEAITESGLLPEPAEQSLRFLIAETMSAFQLQPRENYHAETQMEGLIELR
jgi:hypothetical protein